MILADELIAIQPGKESSGTYRMLLQELNEIKDKYIEWKNTAEQNRYGLYTSSYASDSIAIHKSK
jgi:hypothetical protein